MTYNTRDHLVKLKAITAQLSQIQMFKEVGNEKYIEDMRTSVMKATPLRNLSNRKLLKETNLYIFFFKMCLYMYVYIDCVHVDKHLKPFQ